MLPGGLMLQRPQFSNYRLFCSAQSEECGGQDQGRATDSARDSGFEGLLGGCLPGDGESEIRSGPVLFLLGTS